MYQHIKVPSQGQKITVNADFSLNVPEQPIIPYIEGDGTGVRSGERGAGEQRGDEGSEDLVHGSLSLR